MPDSQMARYALEHECGICIGTMGAYFAAKASSLEEACRTKFSEALCLSSSFPATFSATLRSSPSEENLRGYCESIDRCTATSRRALASAAEQTSGLDVRVVRGLGSRGYGSVRLSLITAAAPSAALDHITIAASSAANFSQPVVKPFTYSEPFQHRWTDKHLSTVVFSMLPGDEAQDADAYRPSQGSSVRAAFSEPLTATVQVGDDTLQLRLPAQGAGVRGIIFADPCISSDFLYCLYEVDFDIHRKLSTFLNVAFAHPKRDVDFWQILGDNFYDMDGSVSPRWFRSLNAEVKAAFFTTVPGNHDIWIDADPRYFRKDDQLGHGFMQYYGQDTIAATHHNASQDADVPFDFSVAPDGVDAHALPPAANFFTYHQLGNLAFFGYSGAHSFEDNAESFSEACLWALEHEDSIDAILLLGHWHAGGNGASFAAATPHTYNAMMTLPHCQPLMHKVRYFMGHRHCNMMTQRHVGFMVGAQGMSDASSCYIVSYLEGAEETFLSSLWRLGTAPPGPSTTGSSAPPTRTPARTTTTTRPSGARRSATRACTAACASARSPTCCPSPRGPGRSSLRRHLPARRRPLPRRRLRRRTVACAALLWLRPPPLPPPPYLPPPSPLSHPSLLPPQSPAARCCLRSARRSSGTRRCGATAT